MVHFYYEVECEEEEDPVEIYIENQYKYLGHEVGDNIQWAGTGDLEVQDSYDPSLLYLAERSGERK